jgi:hypothetical protein
MLFGSGGRRSGGAALACSARLDAAPRFETLFTSLSDVETHCAVFGRSATVMLFGSGGRRSGGAALACSARLDAAPRFETLFYVAQRR